MAKGVIKGPVVVRKGYRQHIKGPKQLAACEANPDNIARTYNTKKGKKSYCYTRKARRFASMAEVRKRLVASVRSGYLDQIPGGFSSMTKAQFGAFYNKQKGERKKWLDELVSGVRV